MKRFTFGFTLMALVLALGFSACKYEEGPILSFKSREARLAKSWKVVKATNDKGEETTSSYEDVSYTMELDSSLTITGDLFGISVNYIGQWRLEDNDANLELEYSLGIISLTEKYIIVKLSDSELWLRDITNDLEELQLEPK